MQQEFFCIKKSARTRKEPWLCEDHFTHKVYRSLYDLLTLKDTILLFDTPEEAQKYIDEHPEYCSRRSIVCKIVIRDNDVQVTRV
jgi:hypothetical protein